MLGLRVSEACGASVTDLHYDSGYELLTSMGKSRKPAQIPPTGPEGQLGVDVLGAFVDDIGGVAVQRSAVVVALDEVLLDLGPGPLQ